MVNYRIFLKRFFPVLTVFVLLVCLCVPVDAAAGDAWYTPIPFSEITLLHGFGEQISDVVTFPFPVSSSGAFSVTDGTYSLDVTAATNSTRVSVTYDVVPDTVVSGIRLVAHDFYWPVFYAENLRDSFQFLFFSSSGQISGDLLIDYKTGGIYPAYGTADGYFYPELQSHSRVVTSSHNLLDLTIFDYEPGDCLFIEELVLTYTFSSSVTGFNLNYPREFSQADFVEWGESQNWIFDYVIYEPADPGDLSFGWLISSVSNTLSVELWPGFSIGGLLRVIFIVGFLFWFLKLTF